jgi:putative membrane protein
MKQLFGVMTFACVVCAAALGAQTPSSAGQVPATSGEAKPQGAKPAGSSAAADATFIRTAAMAGMAEVEHGRLAATNATHDEVKQFGQRMTDDHGKALDELKGLASQKAVTLPTELDAKHKAMQDKLSKMKGAAFDRAYMAHMVSAHQQAVALFQKEASGGKDADAKAWAAKTLPTVQEHLKMARSIHAKVMGTAKGEGASAK